MRSPVESAAIEWWEGRRPMGWSDAQHVGNPRVNCSTFREERLADACAWLVGNEHRDGTGLVDAWEVPPTAECTACGHHINQHNGATLRKATGAIVASGYCVACSCGEFLPRAVRVERSGCDGSAMPAADAGVVDC